MNIKESNKIAIQITSILGIVVTLMLSYFYLSTSFSLIVLFSFLFSFILISYWIISGFIEKYISEHIKVIYKLIHNQKVKKAPSEKNRPLKVSSIESVHQQVLDWSENYEKEISHLKELEKYRKEYIGNISHELKTPLFAIQGYISTLLEGGLDDETINMKYLERSDKNLNRLISIVNELETINQLESGEVKLEKTRFNIKALTDELIESFEMKAENRNMRLYYGKAYDKPIYVIADKNQIEKLLTNLISNAIKYGYANTGKVKISFFDMDTNLLIEVTDNGPGISKEDLPRIFERFYRTDRARSREMGGTGLGLAIVKHIVEAHKQTIYTRSTVGIGTTFGFTLEKG